MATHVQTEPSTQQPPVQKFSRYRSVRKAASEQAHHATAEGQRSRYHGRHASGVAGPTIAEHPASFLPKPYRPTSNHPEIVTSSQVRDNIQGTSQDGQAPIERHDEDEGALGANKHYSDQSRREPSTTFTQRSLPDQEAESAHKPDGIEQFQRVTRHLRRSLSNDPNNSLSEQPKHPLPKLPTQPDVVAISPVDAPISAVNSGDRKVNVLWDDDVVELTVKPDTTARRLIAAASSRLSKPNHTDLVLIEAFSQLGLERPIRQYEYIRDVLNSWDRDDMNALVIRDWNTLSSTSKLTVSSAPPTQPESCTVQLYHSQQPGVWDRRSITLRSDGQIMIAKRLGADQTKICHLSDFDVYFPTRRRMAKIKPPRKYCLAIKSQQKSNLFLDGKNYVHFFSTGDPGLLDTWHDAVQSWRSWYLVDVHQLNQPSRRRSTIKRQSFSQGDDLGSVFQHGNLSEPSLTRVNTVNKLSRERFTPPSSFPRAVDSSNQDIDYHGRQGYESDDNTPKPSVDIGRSNTNRRPGTANSNRITRNGTIGQHSSRPSSRRQSSPSKPLVDLTPAFQEAPQHAKKGRRVSTTSSNGFLVDKATGFDHLTKAINPPSTSAFRRLSTSQRPDHSFPPTSHPQASQSRRHSLAASITPDRPPTRERNTDQSQHQRRLSQLEPTLLTSNAPKFSSQFSQGITTSGHGIASYNNEPDDWNKPLLDVRLKSEFADGSLLRRLEVDDRDVTTVAGDGVPIPRFDRTADRRVEGVIKTGEGV